jgi:hypothetical protein
VDLCVQTFGDSADPRSSDDATVTLVEENPTKRRKESL